MSHSDVSEGVSTGGRALLTRAEAGVISLLAANLGVLILFFAYNLNLFQLAVVYWWECLWIGIFSALKLIVASVIGSPYENDYVDFSRGSSVLTSVVAIGFVSTEFLTIFGFLGMAILFAFKTLSEVNDIDLLVDGMGTIFLFSVLFLISHGISFFVNFIGFREFKTARVGPLLALPFKRCFALIGVVAVAFACVYWIPAFANTTGFAIALILVKLLWDYRLHKRERRALR
jgi:hypothetical protein